MISRVRGRLQVNLDHVFRVEAGISPFGGAEALTECGHLFPKPEQF